MTLTIDRNALNNGATKKHGIQNYQTGIVEEEFETLHEASKRCDELNGKYVNVSECLKDFRTVFIVSGKVYDSEREYINS
jgi:hypothetical protein